MWLQINPRTVPHISYKVFRHGQSLAARANHVKATDEMSSSLDTSCLLFNLQFCKWSQLLMLPGLEELGASNLGEDGDWQLKNAQLVMLSQFFLTCICFP